MQRTYLPGDATLTGWSGYVPASLGPSDCGGNFIYASIISDCSQAHGIYGVSTNSDVAGREMVMGPLLVMCGSTAQTDWGSYNAHMQEYTECESSPQSHTQTIFLSWYTPHAYTVDASGHGTYTELVEKQAGDQPTLAVYVTRGNISGPQQITDLGTFNDLAAKAQQAFKGPLIQNQIVSYSW
jgi:hypothetical protein